MTDHHAGRADACVRVRVDDGTAYDLPAALFFRGRKALLPADRAALRRCRGRGLDVGAGAGAIALLLQEDGFEVTALEVLPGLVALLRARGVREPRRGDLFARRALPRHETVLALMNGTAAAGTLAGLAPFLAALARPLAEGGQILVDSTDLRGREGGARARRPDGRYVGELQYQLEYDGARGAPFPQLFVDPERLGDAAAEVGLTTEVAWRGRSGDYLARLTRV